MLQVQGGKIVDERGQEVRLRGVCVGGWMNGEDFMLGYPGAEHMVRRTMAAVLGEDKTRFIFERWMDYFFTEEDVKFIASCGANVVRLPVNYRHFESDAEPFKYLEAGFARLDRAIEWCARHGLYAIIDLHAVQGWHNTDWHSDNAIRAALFWEHPHFQDRFVALWEEFARRYKGNPAVAGYDLMNEPATNAPAGRFKLDYPLDFDKINRIYRRAVEAIRKIDPEHIIFLEGDALAQRFDGLEPPFADNLVYSSHPYNASCFFKGEYPGPLGADENKTHYDLDKIRAEMLAHQGAQFMQRHQAPLWLGEIGIIFGGPPADHPYRINAFSDQLTVAEEMGAHWTTWNYKDIGVMGWLRQGEESAYVRAIEPVLQAKSRLMADFGAYFVEITPIYHKLGEVADVIQRDLPESLGVGRGDLMYFLPQVVASTYVAQMLQPLYADCFKPMDEARIDRVMQSWALENCEQRGEFIEMLKGKFAAKD